MDEHKHFFSYSKEASTPARFVTICQTCGTVKVTDVPIGMVAPAPGLPASTPPPYIDPWRSQISEPLWRLHLHTPVD